LGQRTRQEADLHVLHVFHFELPLGAVHSSEQADTISLH